MKCAGRCFKADELAPLALRDFTLGQAPPRLLGAIPTMTNFTLVRYRRQLDLTIGKKTRRK